MRFFRRKKDSFPRERVELYKAGDGWRYRVKAGNSKIVGATEQGLKQYMYALRRAHKQFPDYPIFRVEEDGSLTPVQDADSAS